MTVHDLIHETTKRLEEIGIPSARLDAEVLLSFCLSCDRIEFLKNPKRLVDDGERLSYQRLIERRLNGEPVAYLTGRKAFWSFDLDVTSDVLIPRPETEIIVEEALAVCRREGFIRPDILDIGTGSGAIALALAYEMPDARVTATDISAAALDVAKKNARKLGLEQALVFLQGDLFKPVRGRFDMIVSNPPYIGAEEYESLAPGVKHFEPKQALWAGQTGVEFYEKLIYQAPGSLKEKGWLLLEIGAKQAQMVCSLMKVGFEHVEVRMDYAGFSRVVKGRRK
jgi:release factor glutamine methyltransferase